MVYLPEHFEEHRVEALHGVIAEHPLGTLVTLQGGAIVADHIPFLLDTAEGEHGRLIGHVARNNPVWHALDSNVEALVVFQASDAYISPSWYASKSVTHEVVPTWNYAVVHVSGPLRIHEGEKWLRGVVGRLTSTMERGRHGPWKMADAPREYIDDQLGRIVGIEMPIARITGKFKMSQNRPLEDRLGAIQGLRAGESVAERDVASAIESLIPRRAAPRQ
jgi:transcriptional regulator